MRQINLVTITPGVQLPTLGQFAYRRQGVIDAASIGILNAIVVWFLFGSQSEFLPVLPRAGESFGDSFVGLMAGPAVVIAFVVSFASTRAVVHKRIRGEITPRIQNGSNWLKKFLVWSGVRAAIGVFAIIGIGTISTQLDEALQVSRLEASTITALVTAVVGYLYSTSAIMHTLAFGQPE